MIVLCQVVDIIERRHGDFAKYAVVRLPSGKEVEAHQSYGNVIDEAGLRPGDLVEVAVNEPPTPGGPLLWTTEASPYA